MNKQSNESLSKIFDVIDNEFLYLSSIRKTKRLIQEYAREIYEAGYQQCGKEIENLLKIEEGEYDARQKRFL